MKIYLDMDGVLTECQHGALEQFGVPLDEWPMGQYTQKVLADNGVDNVIDLTGDEFWSNFDERFWARLKKTQLCDDLIDICAELVGKNNVFIASRPTSHPGSWSGKYTWILENLSPWIHNQVSLITYSKSALAKPGTMLIDDTASNVIKFQQHGGLSILVPRPWNGNNSADSSVINTVAQILEVSA